MALQLEELAEETDDEPDRLDDAHDEDDEDRDEPGPDGGLLHAVPAELMAGRAGGPPDQ